MAKGLTYENLQGVLETIRNAGENAEVVSISDIHARLGRRSFGPLLVIAGLAPMTPLSTIPGLATLMALIVLLTAGQMLVGMRTIWLPEVIRRQSVSRKRLDRVVDLALPVARFIDRFLRPRLTFLTREPYVYVIAATCCLLALTMPPLEFVPMTSGIPAFPVVAFGLAMIARDGVLVIIGATAIAASALGVTLLGVTIF